METRQVKLLYESMGQILNLLKSLNINEPAISTHSSTLNTIRKKIDGYMVIHKDQEKMKLLSPEEQRVLVQNTNNFYSTYQKLEKEIDYLQMTKYPQFIANALNTFESGYTKLEYFYTELIGICGDIILPHLSTIKVKYWDKSTYKQKVTNLTIELEAQIHDTQVNFDNTETEDDYFYIYLVIIHAQFAEAYIWLKKERERLQTEALPELTSIDIPEELLPQIPKSPVDKGN